MRRGTSGLTATQHSYAPLGASHQDSKGSGRATAVPLDTQHKQQFQPALQLAVRLQATDGIGSGRVHWHSQRPR